MTDRLYYEDPYLLIFDAIALHVQAQGDVSRVWLDRSAFYPTSGGQPFDKGTLNGYEVLDVAVEDGDVVHTIAGAIRQGERVHGSIDEPRRRDHMQQHCGEHMLAYTVWKRFRGFTHGLHIGEDFSSIDVTMPDGATHIADTDLIALETEVNEWIQRNKPVRCWFPSEAELQSIPLRKESTVKEHVRIVHVAPDEYVACGGTHPRNTGEVGCIRILDARPSRGKVRLSFLCGMRAVADNRRKTDACLQAAERLSTSWERLPDAVDRLSAKAAALSTENHSLRREIALSKTDSLLAGASIAPDGTRVVCAILQGLDAATLREVAGALTSDECCCALLASRPEPDAPALLAFARGEKCAISMGALLSEAAKTGGGKGGGKPDFAQGSARDPEAALRYAEKLLLSPEQK